MEFHRMMLVRLRDERQLVRRLLVLVSLVRPRDLREERRRARVVGQGGGRSQPAAQGRGRGSRGRARVGQTETGAAGGLDRPDQQQILMDEIHAMSRKEMEARLVQTVRINPGLMFYVMRPAVAPKGGFHPSGGQQTPPWCSCGKCRDMPTPVERVCCGKRVCITHTPDGCCEETFLCSQMNNWGKKTMITMRPIGFMPTLIIRFGGMGVKALE
ncbi:uncharacterized protein LOC127877233 [Dreissena polymorpha]|uniref:uncharacterized protein LOC127877233 n=1 Tax=Dreissena polymorpha TaxID=45954 RepID=UPI00226423F1|nr:uncharacterized protein LOC127877233 [Dreissena polymorpha]